MSNRDFNNQFLDVEDFTLNIKLINKISAAFIHPITQDNYSNIKKKENKKCESSIFGDIHTLKWRPKFCRQKFIITKVHQCYAKNNLKIQRRNKHKLN